jgi:DNA-binding response OmpR family regulator
MSSNLERLPVILVIEDEEETRYGIKRLLTASGYHVDAVKNEEEAGLVAAPERPDLILISRSLHAIHALAVAKRIRERTGLGDEVPVVFFGVTSLGEGTEAGVEFNVYLTRPDNFDQLRALLSRLLRKLPPLG